MGEKLFSSGESRCKGLEILMLHSRMFMFSYDRQTDSMDVYDARLEQIDTIRGVLHDPYRKSLVHPEDFWKLQEFLEGELQGPIEIRVRKERDADYQRMSMDALGERADGLRIGSMKNVTQERKREEIWQEQAQRDSLTGLYNNHTGKILIRE